MKRQKVLRFLQTYAVNASYFYRAAFPERDPRKFYDKVNGFQSLKEYEVDRFYEVINDFIQYVQTGKPDYFKR